jgi:hypothetical protein
MTERIDEKTEEWKERASRAGDTGGTGHAAEEHRRYEDATGDDDASRPEDGALRPPKDKRRHDTPPGTEQTAG